ncbi:glycosyltransferase family 2 protein [Candidatus Atelocyanobacterium thalassae]|uniref:Glycosyltransferase n=1 Tax=cyanobacterium endosymbiont of Braarudosphaera bigelowii TaxID=1285375 RepID=A0ABN6JZS6_9CHRO|nr:glycosyltransferase family 2 protein [Candidatus Atelocyanobacterium thalassa]BDA39946.1 putative glycosyltransferase [cyanobacterium endosymbiont of Braarudosphaera bigelowii]
MHSNPNQTEMSVIIPCYNEEQGLEHLFTRVLEVLDRLNLSYEVICVDDGSQDQTLKYLINYHYLNPQIKVISLSRNFGKDIALTAGLENARGQVIIPIDADLQDPPELIEKLLQKWYEGYDVVYGKRRSRQGESFIKRFTANAFYRVISKIGSVSIPQDTGDFRLLDRKVVDALKAMPERTRFMKGLFAWVGFKQTYIVYDRPSRFQGTSKWNYWQLWNFALDGITSFSLIPLKVWSYLGVFVSFLSFIYGSFLIIRTLALGIDVPGYASLMVTTLFIGGLQLITLGILGEYLGRIYEETKQRPLYLIKERHGFRIDS